MDGRGKVLGLITTPDTAEGTLGGQLPLFIWWYRSEDEELFDLLGERVGALEAGLCGYYSFSYASEDQKMNIH